MIYAIGDQVDASLGLPFSRGAFVTNPEKLPGDPNPAAYQPYDPEAKKVLEGIYVAGWSRNASVGLVGVAKQDAERGMKVVNDYLGLQGRVHRRRDGSQNRGDPRHACKKKVPPL